MDFSAVKYKRHFIQQMICRIDFLDYLENEIVFDEKVNREIRKDFPNVGKDQQINFRTIDVDFRGKQPIPSVSGQQVQGIQKHFAARDGMNKLILSNKFLIAEIKKYSTFSDFVAVFRQIVNSIYDRKALTTERIGLRYINVFDSRSIKIKKVYFASGIANFLTPIITVDDVKTALIRSMHLSEYRFNDLSLNFRFGCFNSEYPSPMRRDDFVLDYDCFSTEAYTSADQVLEFIHRGHEYIQKLFENSITDRLRQVMKNG